ncbi:hypothetical protein [Litorisediminicola beolgyonensis]|uniref:DUF2946 domain-containing protein n=1 Tax=Litorisediminicola beolgyonensis TaxID=1173614 RepID=A0ABW3ZER8_9RHOB
MLARWCLTLFLILSGGVIAASPVASAAMALNMLCAGTGDGPHLHAPDTESALNAHAHRDHAASSEQPDLPGSPGTMSCCDHASVSELSVSMPDQPIVRLASPVLHDWSGQSLTALSHPDGLRRPPKG